MKKTAITIILTLILISIIGNVSASGFSPSSLTYNLQPSKEGCQEISITSDSPTITISDAWAENKNIEWKVRLFNTSASEHGISMSYPSSISKDQRQVKICLIGNTPGEYHGIILLKEAQEGNSIVQMGIWLKAIIAGQETTSQTQTPTTTTTTQPTTQTPQASATPQTQTNNNKSQQQNTEEKTSLITGGITGIMNSTSITIIILFVILLAILTLIAFRGRIVDYIKWKKAIWQNNI